MYISTFSEYTRSDIHFAMAMCSSKRMIVATGSWGARAVTNSESIVTGPTFWKPLGTVWRILIGYPFAVLRSRQYNHAAIDNTKMTNAFLATMTKKNIRPNKNSGQSSRMQPRYLSLTAPGKAPLEFCASYANGIKCDEAR